MQVSVFHFNYLPDQAGYTPNATQIQLANNSTVKWTDNYSYAAAGNAIDIITIILHEPGHIFLGGGHSVDDGTSLMWNSYPGRPFRSITTCDRQALLNLYPRFNITIDNNFTDNTGNGSHGKVGISGYSGDQTVPITIKKAPGQSVTLTAISPQTDNQNFQRIWHNGTINYSVWWKNDQYFRSEQFFNFLVTNNDNNAKYQAQLRKICKPNFQNSFVSIGNGGVIRVNNTQYNSPTAPFVVVELNPINGSAVSGQILNGINYTFDHWSDGSTSANKTFNPSSTTTYTAYYKGKPSRYDLNLGYNLSLHTSTVVGEPITLYWNEHPNTYVTKYQIWRKEKYNGVTSDPHLLATVNRGTTSFTDDDFYYTTIKNQYMLYYDVRPYYIIENSYAEALWMPVFTEYPMYKTADSTLILSSGYDNFISNHPNHFNPITNISFSIKDTGLVNIRVFDVIGNEIATIVNEEKNPGKYEVTFDASALSSGVYLYTITSGSFMQTRKMLLMK